MNYSDEQVNIFKRGFHDVKRLHTILVKKILFTEVSIKNVKAREFLMQGVKIRLDILYQCIENIFNDFPPESEKLLGIYKITDININLHAFLINVIGIIENLALFIAYEKNLLNPSISEEKQRKNVGLFKKEFLKKLPPTLQDYFSKNGKLYNWYDEYARNYRDALAHRIPPFVPPMQLNEKEAEIRIKLDKEIKNFELTDSNYNELRDMVRKSWTIGSPAKYFFHSISEKSRFVVLHGQILNDFITLKDMIFFVLENIDV